MSGCRNGSCASPPAGVLASASFCSAGSGGSMWPAWLAITIPDPPLAMIRPNSSRTNATPTRSTAMIASGDACAEESPAVCTTCTTLRSLGDRRLRVTAGRFADAFERGEIDTILAMLAEDATFTMPPYPEWRRGRDAMARSWLMPVGPRSLRYLPTGANGQLAFGVYAIEPETDSYLPIALDVVTLAT